MSMHGDVPPLGEIETSNITIKKIWQPDNDSSHSTLFGHPTDRTQLEKNEQTANAPAALETELYSFDRITWIIKSPYRPIPRPGCSCRKCINCPKPYFHLTIGPLNYMLNNWQSCPCPNYIRTLINKTEIG